MERDSSGASLLSSRASASAVTASESNRVTIVMQSQPPPFVFASDPFQIRYSMIGLGDSLPRPDIEASLVSVPVQGTDTSFEVPEDLTLDSAPEARWQVEEAGFTGSMRCAIKIPAVPKKGVAVRIRLVITFRDHDEPTSTETEVVRLVVAKLHVQNNIWETPFYKDVGGKTKGQEVLVEAYGLEGLYTEPEPIELTATLCYEATSLLDCDQSYFDVQENERIEPLGKGKVKFRVNSVSKNHNSRAFVVCLTPAERHDIAPVETEAFQVKSKPGNSSTQATKREGELPHAVKVFVGDLNIWMHCLRSGFKDHQWRLHSENNVDGTGRHPTYVMSPPNGFFDVVISRFETIIRPQVSNLISLAEADSEEEQSHQPALAVPQNQTLHQPALHPGTHPFYPDLRHNHVYEQEYDSSYAQQQTIMPSSTMVARHGVAQRQVASPTSLDHGTRPFYPEEQHNHVYGQEYGFHGYSQQQEQQQTHMPLVGYHGLSPHQVAPHDATRGLAMLPHDDDRVNAANWLPERAALKRKR